MLSYDAVKHRQLFSQKPISKMFDLVLNTLLVNISPFFVTGNVNLFLSCQHESPYSYNIGHVVNHYLH